MLRTSQTSILSHRCLLWCGGTHTLAQALRWVITLLRHGNATLRGALRKSYTTIPTTRLRCVKCTNISSVGSWRMVWRRTMTPCWRRKTTLCISQHPKMGMAFWSSTLACQMIRLLGSGNYILSRMWDGMTITNALSNTGVETSSKARQGWCGSQPRWSISFTPLSIALSLIRHRNPSMPRCALRTGGGRHRNGEILEDNHMLIDVKSTLWVEDTLALWIFMSNGTHLPNFAGDKREWPVYMTMGNLSSKIRQMPSMHSIVLGTLLPIPIRNCNIPQKRLDEQRQTNRDALNDVLRRLLQPMPHSRQAIFTEDSTCVNIVHESWATSRSPTCSIQCRSTCLTTSRSEFSTSWGCTNGLTSTMQSGFPCLLTTTSHQKSSHMGKFLNGMGRRWGKWAGTCL